MVVKDEQEYKDDKDEQEDKVEQEDKDNWKKSITERRQVIVEL